MDRDMVVYVWASTWLIGVNKYITIHRVLVFLHPQKEHPVVPFRDYMFCVRLLRTYDDVDATLINSTITFYDIMPESKINIDNILKEIKE